MLGLMMCSTYEVSFNAVGFLAALATNVAEWFAHGCFLSSGKLFEIQLKIGRIHFFFIVNVINYHETVINFNKLFSQ